MLRSLLNYLPSAGLVCCNSIRNFSDDNDNCSRSNNNNRSKFDFSHLCSQHHTPSSSSSSLSSLQDSGKESDYFDGHFNSGLPFIDNSMLSQMQERVKTAMTPEMQESISSFLQNSNLQNLMKSGPHGTMGMMAFGVGENEKGKKVARAAQMTCDMETGKVHKDFTETQLEEDDISLPKETVENYDTEGAMQVEFVEDAEKVEANSSSSSSAAEDADTTNDKKNNFNSDNNSNECECGNDVEIEVETVEHEIKEVDGS